MADTPKAAKNEVFVGATIHRWTVIGTAPVDHRGARHWRCRCQCGVERVVSAYSLRINDSLSCGCYRKEASRKATRKHGGAGTAFYRRWQHIVWRCTLARDPSYPDYGGRGIKICDAWRNDFAAFRDWAYANGYSPELTIERNDVNGDYCPENCSWIPGNKQAENKRNTRRAPDGTPLVQIARANGIPTYLLNSRMQAGWSAERATTQPRVSKKRAAMAPSDAGRG